MKIRYRFFFCLVLQALVLAAQQNTNPVTRFWPFNGSLDEANGACPFYAANPPVFINDNGRKVLKLSSFETLTSNDDSIYSLSPGLRFACRVKLTECNVHNGWTTIVSKGHINSKGAFALRVDKFPEAPKFSFFINFNGSPEPRVSSEMEVKTNVWYDIEGGWDGQELWLTVNGKTTRRPRIGRPIANLAPLAIGPLEGTVANVSFSGKGTADSLVGFWPFDGSIKDFSGHGHDFTSPHAEFADGKALRLAPFSTPDADDLHLIPGFRIQCSVLFHKMPVGETMIVCKQNEYLLRYDAKGDGTGAFNAFFHLDGHWEPRASCPVTLELNRWYHLSAAWDGLRAYIQANGHAFDIARIGIPKPSGHPLEIGNVDGLLDNLAIDSLRLPTVTLSDIRTTELFPIAGRPLTVQATLTNIAPAIKDCKVQLSLPQGVVAEESQLSLGALPAASTISLHWKLNAGKSAYGTAKITVIADGNPIATSSFQLSVMDANPPDRSSKVWNPHVKGQSSYYINALDGDDAKDGRSPNTAWKTFNNINGKTLQAGERLLLRRGSVFNQELIVTAHGTPDNWAEISAYGVGPRPAIKRNRFINDRCAYIVDPDYLVIRNLVFCNAGKGLDVTHAHSGHRGLLVENCLAHHIEGLYRFNAHGIPEWRDQHGAPGSGNAGGIAVGGQRATDIVFRDCEMYQCSVAFRGTGDYVFFDRLFCHDNYAHNTSPHPVLSLTSRSILSNSIFDASGWNASAGTMGIMLGPNYGLVIRNCFWLNQPDSGSHDEGGIDFEAGGEANIIEHCTFRNNAGAAIEVLGLRSPQAKNITIQNCRFDKNNTATKLGPAEIFVWGGSKDPSIVCSNGLVRNNGYVLLHGIDFYANKAESTIPHWHLVNNTAYNTSEAMDQAMPFNEPPMPAAGPEIWTDKHEISLVGKITDDRRTATSVTASWEQLEGPAIVSFKQPEATATTAVFPAVGDYRLNLKADDGEFWRTSRTAVHILPKGTQVVQAWTFSKNLDSEGWTDEKLGTEKEIFKGEKDWWGTFANPVKLVCGDFYVLAIKNATTPSLLSSDNLALDAAACPVLAIRLQNHTHATRMNIAFTTNAEPQWKPENTVAFDVIPNDENDTLYQVNLAANPNYQGALKRLKLGFNDGTTSITGTCRIDYIWLGSIK